MRKSSLLLVLFCSVFFGCGPSLHYSFNKDRDVVTLENPPDGPETVKCGRVEYTLIRLENDAFSEVTYCYGNNINIFVATYHEPGESTLVWYTSLIPNEVGRQIPEQDAPQYVLEVLIIGRKARLMALEK